MSGDAVYLAAMSRSAEVRLECGVCHTTLVTEAWSSERKDKVIADFNEAHAACREQAAARVAS